MVVVAVIVMIEYCQLWPTEKSQNNISVCCNVCLLSLLNRRQR